MTSSKSEATSAPLTRAEFIKQAEAICAKAKKNICRGKHRAKAKRREFNPLLKARCGGKHKRRSKH